MGSRASYPDKQNTLPVVSARLINCNVTQQVYNGSYKLETFNVKKYYLNVTHKHLIQLFQKQTQRRSDNVVNFSEQQTRDRCSASLDVSLLAKLA